MYGRLLLPAGRRREQIEDYLFRRIRPSLPILGFEERAAQWQAEQRVRLRQMGRAASYPDAQIAAIAPSVAPLRQIDTSATGFAPRCMADDAGSRHGLHKKRMACRWEALGFQQFGGQRHGGFSAAAGGRQLAALGQTC